MTTTFEAAQQARRQQERIALMAIAQHVFDHELDVPHSMAMDRVGSAADCVVVAVHPDSAEAWVDSIAVDEHTSKPLREPNAFGRPTDLHIVAGRLPVLGHRVVVRYYEPAAARAAHLTVVGA